MDACWAHPLGGCAGGLSGEHIVTESLWLGEEIGVRGLPWCREVHKFIGKSSYTADLPPESVHSSIRQLSMIESPG